MSSLDTDFRGLWDFLNKSYKKDQICNMDNSLEGKICKYIKEPSTVNYPSDNNQKIKIISNLISFANDIPKQSLLQIYFNENRKQQYIQFIDHLETLQKYSPYKLIPRGTPLSSDARGSMALISSTRDKEINEKILSTLEIISRSSRHQSSQPSSSSGRGDKSDGNTNNSECIKPINLSQISFNDIAGQQDVKNDIKMNYIYPFQFPNMFPTKSKGILFYGPPGTGKTLLAKASTREIPGAAFFAPTPGDLKGKYEGESEKAIRNLFSCALDLVGTKRWTEVITKKDVGEPVTNYPNFKRDYQPLGEIDEGLPLSTMCGKNSKPKPKRLVTKANFGKPKTKVCDDFIMVDTTDTNNATSDSDAPVTSDKIVESDIGTPYGTVVEVSSSIVFIDEAESLVGKRSGDDPSMVRSTNAFLQGMDGIEKKEGVSVIAATNYPWNIDDAIERRFSAKIFIDKPDLDAIRWLIKDNLNRLYLGADEYKRLLSEDLQGYISVGSSSSETRPSGSKQEYIFSTVLLPIFKKHSEKTATYTPGVEDEFSDPKSRPRFTYITEAYIDFLAKKMSHTTHMGKLIDKIKNTDKSIIDDMANVKKNPRDYFCGYSGSDITSIVNNAIRRSSLRALEGLFVPDVVDSVDKNGKPVKVVRFTSADVGDDCDFELDKKVYFYISDNENVAITPDVLSKLLGHYAKIKKLNDDEALFRRQILNSDPINTSKMSYAEKNQFIYDALHDGSEQSKRWLKEYNDRRTEISKEQEILSSMAVKKGMSYNVYTNLQSRFKRCDPDGSTLEGKHKKDKYNKMFDNYFIPIGKDNYNRCYNYNISPLDFDHAMKTYTSSVKPVAYTQLLLWTYRGVKPSREEARDL